jgi:hypothetical protein
MRSHGCRQTSHAGFALEVGLVLPTQHAIRLVHGLLFSVRDLFAT